MTPGAQWSYPLRVAIVMVAGGTVWLALVGLIVWLFRGE